MVSTKRQCASWMVANSHHSNVCCDLRVASRSFTCLSICENEYLLTSLLQVVQGSDIRASRMRYTTTTKSSKETCSPPLPKRRMLSFVQVVSSIAEMLLLQRCMMLRTSCKDWKTSRGDMNDIIGFWSELPTEKHAAWPTLMRRQARMRAESARSWKG